MAQIVVGPWQRLIFREKDNYQKGNYNGYHICIYVTKFALYYQRFEAENLLFTKHRFADKCDTLQQALDWQQFRIREIGNESKETIHPLEHEVRSLYHPSFRRPLVNRMGHVGIYCNQ